MAIVKPFQGIRPPKELVEKVQSRPYDVLNSEEARAEYDGDKEQIPIYYQALTYYNSWDTETCFMELSLDYTNLQINLILRASQIVTEEETTE